MNSTVIDGAVVDPMVAVPTRPTSKLSQILVASKYNFKANASHPVTIFFSIALPIFMFLTFGTGHPEVKHSVGNGNVSATILVSMVTYGLLFTLSMLGTMTALERSNGWIRQIALTPLRISGWIVSKFVAAMGLGLITIAVCYAIGYFTDAQMTTTAWIGTALSAWLCAAMSAPFGLMMAFLLGSDRAFGVVGASTTIFGFASGMFMPISQMGPTMAKIAEFMPYYGVNRIPRAFIYGLDTLKWQDVVSVVAWFVIFSTIAFLAARKKSER